MKAVITLVFTITAFINTALAQYKAGIIDIYGAPQISRKTVLNAAGIKEGDSVGISAVAIKERLMRIPGIKDASASFVCCDSGKEVLYLGLSIQKHDTQYRKIRGAAVRLPDTLTQLNTQFYQALKIAVGNGDSGDEFTKGYSLFHNPAVRAIQSRFPQLADLYFGELKAVLDHSADGEQRAVAAMILAYSSNKKEVVKLLNGAASDPYPEVRNNIFRAFAPLGAYAAEHPELHLAIRSDLFVQLLNSLTWTDRNKALFALISLTQNRDQKLLSELKKGALGSLIEMSQWRGREHAMLACIILGRIQGIPDDEIFKGCKSDSLKLKKNGK